MSREPPASTPPKGTGVKKSAKKPKSKVAGAEAAVAEQDEHPGGLEQIGLLQAGKLHAHVPAPAQPPAEHNRKVQEVTVKEWSEQVEDDSGDEKRGLPQAGTTPAHLQELGLPPGKNSDKVQEAPVKEWNAKDAVVAATSTILDTMNYTEAVAETTPHRQNLQDTLRAIAANDWKEQCPAGHKLEALRSHHRWHECSVCTKQLEKGEKILWCLLCNLATPPSHFAVCVSCTPSSEASKQKSLELLEERLRAQELMRATRALNMAAVQDLLSARADPALKAVGTDKEGSQRVWSCVHAATDAGFLQALPVLLSHCPPAELMDDNGRSPVHVAVVAGQPDAIQLLVQGRVDVNTQDCTGQLPIHLAACRGGPTAPVLLRALLAASADANAEDRAGRVAYECAEVAAKKNQEALEHAAEQDQKDCEVRVAYERVERAAKTCQEALQVLEAYKPDPGSRQLARELCTACAQGDAETVRSLLENGAEVRCRAPGKQLRGGAHTVGLPLPGMDSKKCPIDGWTPLHAAVESEALDIVRMLLEVQADVNAAECSPHQLLPIHRAANSGNGLVLRALVGAMADVNAVTANRWTSLHYAGYKGHIEIAVTLAAELKADIHATDTYGWTALHLAADWGHADTVEALLAWRADPMTKGVRGKVPLNLAMEYGYVDAAKHLLTAGSLNVSEELIPHCWAALINSGDCLATAIDDKTATVVVRDLDIKLLLRATFCTVSPKTLLVEVPEKIRRYVDCGEKENIGIRKVESLLLLPSTAEPAAPFWSTLTRPPVTSKCRLVKLDLGCDPTHQAIIRAFANTPNEAAHALPVATALLEHAWGGVEAWYYVEILWCYSVLACACIVAKHLNQEGEAPHRELAVMLVGIAKRVLDEIAQLLDMAMENIGSFQAPAALRGKLPEPVSKGSAFAHATFMYIKNPMNQVDIVCLVLDTAAVMHAFNFRGTPFQTGLIGVSGASMWLRALYLLRGSRKFGTRLLPILSAVKDTLAFFIVMAFVFAAVTHYYYLTGGAGTELFPAFEKVYRLCLWADFDIVDWQGLSPGFVMVNDTVNGLQWVPEDPPHTNIYPLLEYLFYATTICVTVIFMNLLIAILNENFSEYETRGPALFQRERANLIVMLRCCPARLAIVLLRRGLGLLAGRAGRAAMDRAFVMACFIFPSGMMRYHYKYWDRDTNPKLVFLDKVEEGEGDSAGEIRSTRFYLNQQITATEKRISQQLAATLKAVQAGQDNLLDAVRQEVAALRRELPSSSRLSVTRASLSASHALAPRQTNWVPRR